MRKTIALIFLAGAVFHWSAARAAEDLQLNAHLNYGSNRPDGQLITGSGMEGGLVAGKANYVIIYAERISTASGKRGAPSGYMRNIVAE